MVILEDVLEIVVPAVKKLSNDDSHLTILPVILFNVNVVLLDPEHTFISPPLIIPLEPLLIETCLVKIVVLEVISIGISPYSQI